MFSKFSEEFDRDLEASRREEEAFEAGRRASVRDYEKEFTG